MHKMHTSGEKNGEKQVGIANQYILDHLLNTIFICRNISLRTLIKTRSKTTVFLEQQYMSKYFISVLVQKKGAV